MLQLITHTYNSNNSWRPELTWRVFWSLNCCSSRRHDAEDFKMSLNTVRTNGCNVWITSFYTVLKIHNVTYDKKTFGFARELYAINTSTRLRCQNLTMLLSEFFGSWVLLYFAMHWKDQRAPLILTWHSIITFIPWVQRVSLLTNFSYFSQPNNTKQLTR